MKVALGLMIALLCSSCATQTPDEKVIEDMCIDQSKNVYLDCLADRGGFFHLNRESYDWQVYCARVRSDAFQKCGLRR